MTIDNARKRFQAFHERAPLAGELVIIDTSKKIPAFVVGELEGVIYKAAGDGKRYIHRFRKDARPVLASSHDGKQMYALAGAYTFTDRGFVDDDKPRKRRKGRHG